MPLIKCFKTITSALKRGASVLKKSMDSTVCCLDLMDNPMPVCECSNYPSLYVLHTHTRLGEWNKTENHYYTVCIQYVQVCVFLSVCARKKMFKSLFCEHDALDPVCYDRLQAQRFQYIGLKKLINVACIQQVRPNMLWHRESYFLEIIDHFIYHDLSSKSAALLSFFVFTSPAHMYIRLILTI